MCRTDNLYDTKLFSSIKGYSPGIFNFFRVPFQVVALFLQLVGFADVADAFLPGADPLKQ